MADAPEPEAPRGGEERWHAERAAWLGAPLEVVTAAENVELYRHLRRSQPARRQHASWRRSNADVKKQLWGWDMLLAVSEGEPELPEAVVRGISNEPLLLTRMIPFLLEMWDDEARLASAFREASPAASLRRGSQSPSPAHRCSKSPASPAPG
mmetsp:Transcript_55443/g.124918  ORF Transcript_55443/g.124918 Transcript_55443/m.124918 type:complete len:153 (+) Transcript_55443:73-531(+)